MKIFDDLIAQNDKIVSLEKEKRETEIFDWRAFTCGSEASYISSRLVPKENFATEESKKILTDAIVDLK